MAAPAVEASMIQEQGAEGTLGGRRLQQARAVVPSTACDSAPAAPLRSLTPSVASAPAPAALQASMASGVAPATEAAMSSEESLAESTISGRRLLQARAASGRPARARPA